MSGFDFDKVGDFASEKDVTDWAKKNEVAPTDVDIKPTTDDGASVAVRRDATDMSKPELRKSSDRGFF